MPHPNVETLRRIDQAQVAGDLETASSQYTDDVLGHVGGDNKLSGDYRGLEQLQAMLGRFFEASGEYSFENHAYLADDEHGIVCSAGPCGEVARPTRPMRSSWCISAMARSRSSGTSPGTRPASMPGSVSNRLGIGAGLVDRVSWWLLLQGPVGRVRPVPRCRRVAAGARTAAAGGRPQAGP
jgi:hypothetical protein